MENIEEVQEEKNHPWFCNLHQLEAEYRYYSNTAHWYCPKCDEIICEAWEEFLELTKEDL